MNPRLKNSKKWTAFPADFIAQIKKALLESFAAPLKGAELVVEGRIYTAEILLRLGYREKDRLRQNNFEVSLDYKNDQAMERIHDAIDAAAAMMGEFLESGEDLELPRIWREVDFEKLKVWCQYSTTNTHLEAEADRLLGEANEHLVKEADADDEDPDAEMAPLAPGEEDRLQTDEEPLKPAKDRKPPRGSMH